MSETRPEFAFINWLEAQQTEQSEVVLGIGDDAAVLSASDRELVVTKDVLVEEVHFTLKMGLELIGRKSLAVNLSDIAAMGAIPKFAFVGLVLPKGFSQDQTRQLDHGMRQLAEEYSVSIVGGDTNSCDGPLVISVTLIGHVRPGQAIRRDGAIPGDQVFVTGPLGGSFRSGRHLRFTPRIKEVSELLKRVSIHSMMDISDGLSSDLYHLTNRSRVGAIIDAASIPIHSDVDQQMSNDERLKHALSDGEDFELLFTVSAEDAKRLMDSPLEGLRLFRIGEITASTDVWLRHNDALQAFPKGGWSHQFGEKPRG